LFARNIDSIAYGIIGDITTRRPWTGGAGPSRATSRYHHAKNKLLNNSFYLFYYLLFYLK